MVIVEKDTNQRIFRIILTPNRSISWPQLLRVYLFTCCMSFSIALIFAFIGYWVVLPFSGLEMLALGAGLYVTNRMVFRQEVISFINGKVKIEKGCNFPEQSWEFDEHWVRLDIQRSSSMIKKTFIFIGSHGSFVEIGSFLDESEKESLVFGLNEGIISPDFLGQNA